jgi:uncharacterized protein
MDEMTSEELMCLVKHLIENVGVFKIDISGGEPLLRIDSLFDILDYLSLMKAHASLFSNSTLVTEDIARRISEQTCLHQEYQTSLDGACASIHDSLRGSGAFDATIRGLKYFVDQGMRVYATCVINRSNFETLPAIAGLATDLGLTSINFTPVRLTGTARYHSKELVLTKAEMDYAYEVVKSLTMEVNVVSGGLILEWPKERIEKLLNEKNNVHSQSTNALPLAGCDICKEGVAITPDGWMVPCNQFWDYKIGNVLTEDFITLYRESERAKAIRDLCSKRSNQLKGCETCEFAYDCTGGCRAEAYSFGGDLMYPNLACCYKQYLEHPEDALWCVTQYE